MPMLPTLHDALLLIQRAEASIATNKDDASYSELLHDRVEVFKKQLSEDHHLPVEFFEPVDATMEQLVDQTETTSDEVLQPENPELTSEAAKLYEEIETSI